MENLVSIVIPCYNHEKYIEDCLISIMNQTYKNIEVIICDDCSPDNSFEIIKSFEAQLRERFGYVTIIKNEINRGVTYNLNRMIKLAKGKYIKEIASDDMLAPNCIKDLVEYIEHSKDEIDFLFSNALCIDENVTYNVNGINCGIKYYNTVPQVGRNLTGEICSNNYIMAPSAIIPKATFDKYGLYDEKYCIEDYEFWLRVSVDGNFDYLDEVTVYYRQTPNSLSRYDRSDKAINRFRRVLKSTLDIYDIYEKYCDKNQKAFFMNKYLATSIDMLDKESINKMIQIMNSKKISIYPINRIKWLLFKANLYLFIKKIIKH